MPLASAFARLPTEQRSPKSRDLDRLPTAALLRLMNREDAGVVRAVGAAIPQIARAVRLIARALARGGRLFFVGAGTSGRLGVLEAAECPPTFSTSAAQIQALIAGGRAAVFRSREGAEDRGAAATRLIARRIRPGDVVVGIAASGVTPFVAGALAAARNAGAGAVLVTGHRRSPIRAAVRIVLCVGPELLTGSTRLKAGTATKLVLNMLTLGAMVRLGKTHGNLMVDVRPTSRKLTARAIRIIQTLAGCSERRAADALRRARGRTKVAVLMAACDLPYGAAIHRLSRVHGSLRRALAGGPVAW
jgi:N-acetylmuramic acid 6-phosphate etherase